MAKFEDYFDSKYLTAADLGKKEHTVIIETIQQQEFNDGSVKPTLYFRGRKKGIVLNKTNATRIKAQYGSDMDSWTGKEVVLYPEAVDFQGRLVDAIRIRVPLPQAVKDVGPNDDIPF